MKRSLHSILAILFPWIVILLDGKFIASMACLALQLTVVGWIPASIWALKVTKRLELQENSINSTQSEPKTQEQTAPPAAQSTDITSEKPTNEAAAKQSPETTEAPQAKSEPKPSANQEPKDKA